MTVKSLLAALLLAGAALPSAAHAETTLTGVRQTQAWVENFNPFLPTTRVFSAQDFVFEPLVIFNVMQGGKPEFRLATDFTYSDDLKNVTIKLRDAVKWSDGESFDADDLAFTFNLLKQYPQLDLQAIWTQIDGFEVIDPLTIRFDFKEPSSGVIYDLVRVYVVPEHIWSKVEDPTTFTNPKPVGSGPMTDIRRFTPQEFLQCRNPNYWDAESLHIDCMRFPQLANNDQVLTAAARGELDWFGSFLPDIERTYVGVDPEHHAYWFPAGSAVMFSLNFETTHEGNREAINDVNFRRAFSMAMDRQAMVDIAGYGYPTINEYPSGLGAAFDTWNVPELEAEFGEYTRFNLDEAKVILQDAGYADTNGDGFLETPSGKPIEFSILAPSGYTDWVNTSQLAVEGLAELGINAGLSTLEVPAWTDLLMRGSFDVSINSIHVGVTPHQTYSLALASRNIGTNRTAAAHYRNSELDDLLDTFYQTNEKDEQFAIMSDVQRIVAKDLPFVAVFNNPLWFEYNTKRFTGWFNADNPVANPMISEGVPERILHLLSLRPVVAD